MVIFKFGSQPGSLVEIVPENRNRLSCFAIAGEAVDGQLVSMTEEHRFERPGSPGTPLQCRSPNGGADYDQQDSV